jgi:hypothetical protein
MDPGPTDQVPVIPDAPWAEPDDEPAPVDVDGDAGSDRAAGGGPSMRWM